MEKLAKLLYNTLMLQISDMVSKGLLGLHWHGVFSEDNGCLLYIGDKKECEKFIEENKNKFENLVILGYN